MFYKSVTLKCNGVVIGNFNNVDVEVLTEEELTCQHDYVNLYSVYVYCEGSIVFCVPTCSYAKVIDGVLFIEK
ncbi:hypothetical protein QTI72_14785 [Clostridium perfringens]|nr:hypothetical protein [Clostridium perfringens]